jgi:hypothetical protein
MLNKVKELVNKLNIIESERLKADGYTNSSFFNPDGTITKEYLVNFKEKKKYFYIDYGTSGAYMIDKSTGEIYNIKAYGQINRAKFLGNINTLTNNDIVNIHSKRYNYK